MTQLNLVNAPTPPTLDGVDLRCCDVAGLLDEVRGAALVVADPPWSYDNNGRTGAAEKHYDCLSFSDIVAHVEASYDCAAADSYLLVWYTFPFAQDWLVATAGSRWSYVTGGAMVKTGDPGIGFHWRGNAEPVAIYKRGKARPWWGTCRSGYVLERNRGHNRRQGSGATHSEKPLPWARDHVRAFCPPGGLVLDLYAGMAPYARAAVAEGRRYVGAEIDPDRHARALGLLANYRPGSQP